MYSKLYFFFILSYSSANSFLLFSISCKILLIVDFIFIFIKIKSKYNVAKITN